MKLTNKPYKLNIACPFCLTELNKWKMFDLCWEYYDLTVYIGRGSIIIPRKSQAFKKERVAREFERKILQEHLTNCSMGNIISSLALAQYKLER